MMSTPPNEESGIERAIKIAGTQSKLAKMIGVTQQTVSHWLKLGIVSDASKCALIERKTGVRCEALNPHENWTVLRDVLCAPERPAYEASDDTQAIGGSVDNAPKRKGGKSAGKTKEARA
jgi:DNA-binding transcriptional regulator YdaS (Cro superfamily)